jgi:hypothetical protein
LVKREAELLTLERDGEADDGKHPERRDEAGSR